MVEQRHRRILHDRHRHAQKRVEQNAVLQQGRRAFVLALHEQLAHQRGHAQRQTDGRDAEDEEN